MVLATIRVYSRNNLVGATHAKTHGQEEGAIIAFLSCSGIVQGQHRFGIEHLMASSLHVVVRIRVLMLALKKAPHNEEFQELWFSEQVAA